MSRLKHDALSQSRQKWRQPQVYPERYSVEGPSASNSPLPDSAPNAPPVPALPVILNEGKDRGLTVRANSLDPPIATGVIPFAPAFRFACSQCGNQLQRRLLNATAGFPNPQHRLDLAFFITARVPPHCADPP